MDVDKEEDMSEWINEKGEAAGQRNLSQCIRKHMECGHLQNDSLGTIGVMYPQEVSKASDKHAPVCRSWHSEWWQLRLWSASCLGWGQSGPSEGVPLSSFPLVGASSCGLQGNMNKEWFGRSLKTENTVLGGILGRVVEGIKPFCLRSWKWEEKVQGRGKKMWKWISVSETETLAWISSLGLHLPLLGAET